MLELWVTTTALAPWEFTACRGLWTSYHLWDRGSSWSYLDFKDDGGDPSWHLCYTCIGFSLSEMQKQQELESFPTLFGCHGPLSYFFLFFTFSFCLFVFDFCLLMFPPLTQSRKWWTAKKGAVIPVCGRLCLQSAIGKWTSWRKTDQGRRLQAICQHQAEELQLRYQLEHSNTQLWRLTLWK